MCTSPKLPEPTDVVVAVDRCGSDNIYLNCMYYVEDSSKYINKTHQFKTPRAKIYAPIHALPQHTTCNCVECEINTTENGVKVAYCKALNRYLTRYDVYLCSRYWKDCPYRQYSYTPERL